jgi:hypothetical protein
MCKMEGAEPLLMATAAPLVHCWNTEGSNYSSDLNMCMVTMQERPLAALPLWLRALDSIRLLIWS